MGRAHSCLHFLELRLHQRVTLCCRFQGACSQSLAQHSDALGSLRSLVCGGFCLNLPREVQIVAFPYNKNPKQVHLLQAPPQKSPRFSSTTLAPFRAQVRAKILRSAHSIHSGFGLKGLASPDDTSKACSFWPPVSAASAKRGLRIVMLWTST